MNYFILFSIFVIYSVTCVNADCRGLPDGYHAAAGQCDAYVKCAGGQVVENNYCNDGLVFDKWGNPDHVRCKYPYGIDCSDRPALQPARSSGECPRSNGIWGHCENYMECIEGKAYYKKCPDGLYFSKTTGTCVWPDQVKECSTNNLFGFTCPPLTEADYAQFVDHARFPGNDCRDIFICMKPTHQTENQANSRKLQCEYGQVFNSVTLQCDEPANVAGCENYYGGLNLKPKASVIIPQVVQPVVATRSSKRQSYTGK